jgi:hypothetical protein
MLAAVSATLFYSPAFFLRRLVEYLEIDPGREEKAWGWVYVIGLFASTATLFLSRPLLHISATLSYRVIFKLPANSGRFRLLYYNADYASN